MQEANVTDADKLNAVLATREGAVQVLTVLSEASHYIDASKAKIRDGKIKIKGWASHKQLVAGIYTGCGIVSGIIGVVTAYYVGLPCIFFIALSVIFIILVSKNARALSLKDYYNREEINEVEEEKRLS